MARYKILSPTTPTCQADSSSTPSQASQGVPAGECFGSRPELVVPHDAARLLVSSCWISDSDNGQEIVDSTDKLQRPNKVQ